MYTYQQVYNGIAKYMDREIVSKISGWQKWAVGAGVSLAMNKSSNTFNAIKNNNIVKALNVIDDNDNIDLDTLYSCLKEQANKGSITFNTSLLGNITLNTNDVDKLYNYIREGVNYE